MKQFSKMDNALRGLPAQRTCFHPQGNICSPATLQTHRYLFRFSIRILRLKVSWLPLQFLKSWMPGLQVSLRGPLGRGFGVPFAARKVALVAYDDASFRLRGLIRTALKQHASVVLISDFPVGTLSDEVEVQPSSAMLEALAWADYAAFDIARENLFGLRESLRAAKQLPASYEAQVLIRTAVPCGGVAECGVCAVSLKSGWQMACKDGPVFDWREI